MLADVFAIILTVVVVTIRLMLLPIIMLLLVWQMLLPCILADVIANCMWKMFKPH